MRNRFDQQLETLHQELIGMGAMCQEAIAAGAAALLDHDPAMAEVAIAREVEIDRSLPLEERKRAYLEAVGNPYAVRVGDMKVRVRFAEDGGSFEEAFENMLRNV